MLTLDHAVRPGADVVDTELDNSEIVLLQLVSKEYYTLNVTGVRIWKALKEGLTLRQISARLQAEFSVDGEEADRSVLDLADQLLCHQLVQIET